MSISPLAHCDVLVVGAGIVGLAHAAAALDAGLTVVVIDRDTRAVGASVRNFGHACVTGQRGELAELAQSARRRWLELDARARLGATATGGVALARHHDELAVLEELAAERPSVGLLTADQTRDLIGGLGADDLIGGAALADDLRVDPRVAVARLAAWLDAQEGAQVLFRTAYLGGNDTQAFTSRGVVEAQRTVLCVGHDLDHLLPDLADEHEVKRCALQMALTAGPGATVAPAVLTATSLLRYHAFSETSAAAALRTRLGAQRADLLGIEANVMTTQRPDGSLIVGDSHHTETTVPPFLEEATSQLLLDETARVLGTGPLQPLQRWQGVYASAPDPFLVADPDPHVSVRIVTSGVGMTIAFGLAERYFPH